MKNTMKKSESQTTEFKSSWRDEYMKIICAFANTEGGELILGVDDKGKPVGLKNAKKLLENMNYYNGHLSDITDTFRTFIGHNDIEVKI